MSRKRASYIYMERDGYMWGHDGKWHKVGEIPAGSSSHRVFRSIKQALRAVANTAPPYYAEGLYKHKGKRRARWFVEAVEEYP